MTLLRSMFQYKAWANEGLFNGLIAQCDEMPRADELAATLILNHSYIVDRIFVANLQRQEHGFLTTASDITPSLEVLFNAVREADRWYIDYAGDISSSGLAETIDFMFTDGTAGRMSREEMLAHVLAHSGYHRGEVGQILTQLTGSSPRDTFTGYLHEVRPVVAAVVEKPSMSE